MFQANGPGDRQASLVEFGMCVEIELPPMRDHIEQQVSRALLIQSEVFNVNMRFQRRLLGGTISPNGEIGNSVCLEASALKARYLRKTEITSVKVQAKWSC